MPGGRPHRADAGAGIGGRPIRSRPRRPRRSISSSRDGAAVAAALRTIGVGNDGGATAGRVSPPRRRGSSRRRSSASPARPGLLVLNPGAVPGNGRDHESPRATARSDRDHVDRRAAWIGRRSARASSSTGSVWHRCSSSPTARADRRPRRLDLARQRGSVRLRSRGGSADARYRNPLIDRRERVASSRIMSRSVDRSETLPMAKGTHAPARKHRAIVVVAIVAGVSRARCGRSRVLRVPVRAVAMPTASCPASRSPGSTSAA